MGAWAVCGKWYFVIAGWHDTFPLISHVLGTAEMSTALAAAILHGNKMSKPLVGLLIVTGFSAFLAGFASLVATVTVDGFTSGWRPRVVVQLPSINPEKQLEMKKIDISEIGLGWYTAICEKNEVKHANWEKISEYPREGGTPGILLGEEKVQVELRRRQGMGSISIPPPPPSPPPPPPPPVYCIGDPSQECHDDGPVQRCDLQGNWRYNYVSIISLVLVVIAIFAIPVAIYLGSGVHGAEKGLSIQQDHSEGDEEAGVAARAIEVWCAILMIMFLIFCFPALRVAENNITDGSITMVRCAGEPLACVPMSIKVTLQRRYKNMDQEIGEASGYDKVKVFLGGWPVPIWQ
jgi:hypothetical protein